MKSILLALLAAALMLSFAPAKAGTPVDALSKCLVRSTTPADRAVLVKWLFADMALDPQLSPYVKMSASVRDSVNRAAAHLFVHLLTQSCPNQARSAYRYAGPSSLRTAFSVLGRVAGHEIFSNPGVRSGMAELQQYIDKDKLKATLQGH